MVYQQCESFFVESYDHQVLAREKRLALENHIKKQCQLQMAQDLSDIARDDYQDDHLEHMERMELETLPDVASIDIQSEIQWFMRPYLLDFLIEAHAAFALLPETLFLTVNILDRYCSKRIVYRKHYQLVGVTALLVAAKYGDCKERVPTIKELGKMCCNLYEEHTFIEMEWHVLQTLDWVVGHPTVDSFLQLARESPMYDAEAEHMALYIAEIAMFHRDFVSKRASDVARSAMALARIILGRKQPEHGNWEASYDERTLYALSNVVIGPSTILSQKYASAHLSRVSTTLRTFLVHHSIINPPLQPVVPPRAALSSTYLQVPSHSSAVYQTPVKGNRHYMPHGALTPPETPDVEVFNAATLSFPPPPQASPTPQKFHEPAMMGQTRYSSYLAAMM